MEAIQHPAGFHYYLLRDIEAELSAERFADFSRWFAVKTGPIGNNDELAVYKYDYDHWVQRQPENALTWD